MRTVRLPKESPCKYCKEPMKFVLRGETSTHVEIYCAICGVLIGSKEKRSVGV